MIVSMEVNETQPSSYHPGLIASTNLDSSTKSEYAAEGAMLSDDEDSPSGDEDQKATKPITHLSPLLTINKRSTDEIDADIYPSKKRRKQSKPVRISSLLSGQSEKDSEDEDINKNDILKIVQSPPSNETFPSTHGEIVLICDFCKENFDKTEELNYHIHTVHTTNLFSGSVNKCNTESAQERKIEFPLNLSNVQESGPTQMEAVPRTWVTSDESKINTSEKADIIHNSMQHHNDFVNSNNSGSSYLQPDSHFLLPMLPQGSAHNQTSPVSQKGPNNMSTSIRIFNPDAFCHLCNKEFCNKYFLKTHKANKHGIYVDTIFSSNFTSSVPPAVSSLPAYSTISSVSSQFVPPKNGECSSSGGIRYSGNLTMRAFCDICHKRFCNKYFVRRHKAKIHGIVEDISAATTSSSFLSLPDYVLKPDVEEQENTSAGSDTGSNNLDCGSAETIDQKDRHENIGNIFSYRTDMCFPANIKQEKDFESEDNLNCESNSVASVNKMSPTSQMSKDSSFSTDQLKKLGVINADAFCEICCKEYCNKYFLRTHKMKRHGILITDSDGKDLKPCISSNSPWINMQTSPLNLIVGENSSSNFDSADKFKSELSDTDDYECDTCRCKFQNAQLMHMHRAYFHSEKNEENFLNPNNINSLDKEDGVLNCENHETCSNQTSENITSNNNEDNIDDSSLKDSVNYDLQKLQTMIIQLNDLTVSKLKVCSICNKDFQNSNYLRDHMIADHGAVIKKYDILQNENITPDNITFTSKAENHIICFVCKKEFVSDDLLKTHMQEHHGHSSAAGSISATVTDSIQVELDNKECIDKNLYSQIQQGNFEKRISLTPTSSYCEICNKELCNKYFMKTHMQRMHGIEIENGAQIGGVICDICNKELCSKYFLRVHKQNTHGIIEEGTTNQPGRESLGIVTPNGNFQTENDHALKPSDAGDLSHRYFTHFTEVCPICNRRFRSTKWLKAHLLSDHGDSGIEKWNELEIQQLSFVQQNRSPQHIKPMPPLLSSTPLSSSPTLKIPNNWHSQHHDKQRTPFREQSNTERHDESNSNHVLSNLLGSVNSSAKNYRCSYCPFSTQVLAFLFVHEKSHTGLSSQSLNESGTLLQCPVCFQSFQKADKFQHHFLTHQFSGLLHPLFSHAATSVYTPPVENIQPVQVVPRHSPSTLEGVANSSQNYKHEVDDYHNEVATTNEGLWKFCCSFCYKRFQSQNNLTEHINSKHMTEDKTTSVISPSNITNNTTAYQKEYKCSHCKFSSTHMIVLKKHIRNDHKSEYYDHEQKSDERLNSGMETEQRANDVKKRLEDAVQKSKLPASYAVPQSHSPCIDGFVMQPFLLEEPNRKFVPSLVFLPVKEKMSEPLTVSFMLTPA